MKLAFAIIVGLILFALIEAFVVFMVLYFRDPQRGNQFLGALAMFARSLFNSKADSKRKHRRRDDEAERVHVRTSRPSLVKTISDFVRRDQ